MRKNNKGFTLIEIIAVVAILGILSVVVVPNIFSLVTQSRDEIYLQDARRLIAQAQYKMSSNSSNIEKPSNGECIVMSLNYLNINDFQSPPHGGAYMSDASFVAIKSDGGTYKYAAMLVEHTSDGIYRGVKLSTEEDLNSKTAHKSITSFNSGEIRYIDSQTALAAGATEAAQVDTAYISRYLKDYGTNQKWLPADGEYIIGRYNYEKEVEHGAVDTSIPKISPKVISSDSKNPESLLVNLTVSAIDADSPLSSLSVCSFVSRNKDLNFPEAGSSFCDSYGTSGNYSKSFDLSKTENGGFSYNEQAIAYVYVAVYDPEKNSDRKKIEYFVRENEAPTIKSFNVIPADDGKFNLSNVKLSAEISDDMDNISDLKFCLQQDRDSEECNSYKSYSEFFNNGVHNYTFVDENGKNLGLDGSKHTLKLFVKDSLGKFSSLLVPYEIYKNEAPSFTKIEMIPNKLDNKNLYSVNFNIDATDDISNIYNLKIKICDKGRKDGKCDEMSMADYNNRERDGLYAFEFSNQEYKGENETVTITLEDEHGLSASKELELTNVYKNRAPSVTINSIVGSDKACSSCDQSNGGGYDANVSFTITDDLVQERDFVSKGFKVCISEKKSDCEKESNFQTYFGGEAVYNFTKPTSGAFADTNPEKKLYIVVIDNFGAKGDTEDSYKIYKNQAPKIIGSFDIKTTEKYNYCGGNISYDSDGKMICSEEITNYTYNVANVSIDTSSLVITDDFDTIVGEMCYTINDGKEQCVDISDEVVGTIDKSISGFMSKLSSGFKFVDNGKDISKLNGQRIKARIKLTDDYGKISYSQYAEYTLFNDLAPELKDISVKTLNVDDDSNVIYNSNQLVFNFRVLDYNDTYTICITEESSCSPDDFVGISGDKNRPFSGNFYDGNSLAIQSLDYDGDAHNWPKDYKYSDVSKANKHFNVFIKDSSGKVKEYKNIANYNVYAACQDGSLIKKDVNEGEEDYVAIDSNNILDAYACSGKCYHKYSDSNELPLNEYKARYAELISYVDNKTNTFCKNEQGNILDLYCDHKLCFMFDQNNINYIGTKYFDRFSDNSPDDETWTYSNELVTEKVNDAESAECLNAMSSGSLLFCNEDSRCKDDQYCSQQGILNCKSEEETLSQAIYSCSYEKLYNPKPCGDGETPENNACYDAPLRPCTSKDETGSECLRTCNAGEVPETDMCTPYSPADINEIYTGEIADPCSEGDDDGTECNFTPKRICSINESPEEYNCIRKCEIINIDNETGVVTYENPRTENCTLKSGLTQEDKDKIRLSCISDKETTYNECVSDYRTSCNNSVTNGFCNNNMRNQSWEVIPCSEYKNNDDYMERYCESNFIDGKCYNNSSKCGSCTSSEISNGTCNDKLSRKNCQRVCYRKVDCSLQTTVQTKIFQCHGAYRVYQKNLVNNRVILQHVDNICPEFYNYYDENLHMTGKDIEYPFMKDGLIKNIWFNQKEQKNIGGNS